ncbi:MAG: NADH-quinone oxidoreductase subunit L, partial [Thioalkalivibrio sp.]|nr:NADH-quinone oxidoreductase subunit L [Thioalkalivibrio sp.]
WLVLAGVFVTALYTFRMFFLVFHGKERYAEASKYMPDHGDDHHDEDHHHDAAPLQPKESPWVVTVPLVLLAIPSVVAGYFIGPLLFGDFFADSLFVLKEQDVLAKKGESYTGVLAFVLHGLALPAFWLAMAGLATAWYLYIKRPDLPQVVADRLRLAVRVLEEKYGFDRFNDWFFAGGMVRLGRALWRYGDVLIIDGLLVNGTARSVGWIAGRIRHMQSGFLYHYAFVMIIGLLVLMFAFVI